MPAISILTPVWNGLPYIKESVESVLVQEFEDWELLVSDNGSTDETRVYLDTLNDPRIRIFKQERNLGIFGNLNFLFSEALAPIAQILCADDYLLPGALTTVLESWNRADPEVGFVIFNYNLSHIRVHRMGFALRSLPACMSPSEGALLFFLFGNNAGNLSNVSSRVSAVNAMGKFRQDLPYAGDWDMWARMAQIFPFVVRGEKVSFVRRHPGVASNYLNKQGELIFQQRKVAAGLFDCVKGRYPTWLLRVHATIIYDVLQRDVGLRRLLFERNGRYLRIVDEVGRNDGMLLSVAWSWFFYVLTLGGRLGRDLIPWGIFASATRGKAGSADGSNSPAQT